jgi:hypothetical protein
VTQCERLNISGPQLHVSFEGVHRGSVCRGESPPALHDPTAEERRCVVQNDKVDVVHAGAGDQVADQLELPAPAAVRSGKAAQSSNAARSRSFS